MRSSAVTADVIAIVHKATTKHFIVANHALFTDPSDDC
jgi:hypothetical protein